MVADFVTNVQANIKTAELVGGRCKLRRREGVRGWGGIVVVMNRFSRESPSRVAPPLLGLSSSQPPETCSFPRLLGRVGV